MRYVATPVDLINFSFEIIQAETKLTDSADVMLIQPFGRRIKAEVVEMVSRNLESTAGQDRSCEFNLGEGLDNVQNLVNSLAGLVFRKSEVMEEIHDKDVHAIITNMEKNDEGRTGLQFAVYVQLQLELNQIRRDFQADKVCTVHCTHAVEREYIYFLN